MMRTQKSHNEGKASKVLPFQLPISKDGVSTTNSKKGNSKAVSRLVERRKGAEARQAQSGLPHFISEEALQGRIAKRAYELFEQRDRQHGYDREDWFQAEHDVLTQKDVG
ncbi:MAG: DUF2934 domain-containing protein [Nitrospira sp.]|nr:DUF2934 domain-containing protein [Nitrospira sp.]